MDYKTWYESISKHFRSKGAKRAVNIADKALVYVIAAAYLLVLAWLAISGDERLWRMGAVPLFTFALVSTIRIKVNSPRPYELYDIDPVIPKDTSGKSMPSRHLASAVIIACALTWLNPAWGIPSFIASAIVACTRIIGGVHFPRDIAAAIAISLACGLIGFAILP